MHDKQFLGQKSESTGKFRRPVRDTGFRGRREKKRYWWEGLEVVRGKRHLGTGVSRLLEWKMKCFLYLRLFVIEGVEGRGRRCENSRGCR